MEEFNKICDEYFQENSKDKYNRICNEYFGNNSCELFSDVQDKYSKNTNYFISLINEFYFLNLLSDVN